MLLLWFVLLILLDLCGSLYTKPLVVHTLSTCGFRRNESEVFRLGLPLGSTASSVHLKHGLEMVMDWVAYEKGGIHVGPNEVWDLEIYAMDDLSSVSLTSDITESFVNTGGVDVVLAPATGNLVETVVTISEDAEKLLLSSAPEASPYFEQSASSLSFQVFPSPAKRLENLHVYAAAGARSVYYICEAGPFCEYYSKSSNADSGEMVKNSEKEVIRIFATMDPLALTFYEVFDTTSLLEGDKSDLDALVERLVDKDCDLVVIDAGNQLFCTEIMVGLERAMPNAVYVTECAQNPNFFKQYNYITTWGPVDYDSTDNSTISGLNPKSWLTAYTERYLAPEFIRSDGAASRLLPSMALYAFTMGEILVNSMERLAAADRQAVRNSSELALILRNSSFSTVLSGEDPISFSKKNVLTADLFLVQNYGDGKVQVVKNSSLVYPIEPTFNKEEESSETIFQKFVEFIMSAGIAVVASASLACCFFAIAYRIRILRLKLEEPLKSELVQLKLLGNCVGFAARGFSFGSEAFLVLDLLGNWQPISAILIVSARALHPLLSIWYVYKIFGRKLNCHPQNKEYSLEGENNQDHLSIDETSDGRSYAVARLLHEGRMLQENKFYAMVLLTCLMDAKGLNLLPWQSTKFTTASDGLPNLAMTRRILGVTLVQSFTVTAVQLRYLSLAYSNMHVATRGIFILSAMAQISIVFVNVIAYATKISLLIKLQIQMNLNARNEDVVHVMAGRKLSEIQGYKENPEEFMKELQSLFEFRASVAAAEIEMRASLVANNDDDVAEKYAVYQKKKSVFEARRSAIIKMLDTVDEEDEYEEDQEMNQRSLDMVDKEDEYEEDQEMNKRVMLNPLLLPAKINDSAKKSNHQGRDEDDLFTI